MVAKHYYYFGEKLTSKMTGNSLNEANWELLRNNGDNGPFCIENDVQNYEENCKASNTYELVADIIINQIVNNNWGKRRIVSCGVGKGILEWHLKNKCPELIVECTDYTKDAINKLMKVFPGMDKGYLFNMLEDDYQQFGDDATVLMFRVSTEFSYKEWEYIFETMYKEGVAKIIFVPTGLDTLKSMCREKVIHYRNRLLGRKDIFCGWIYSETEFLRMFKGKGKELLYIVDKKIDIPGNAIYFLKSSKCR